MKKTIAIILSILTIITCVWLILNRLDLLYIPANKIEHVASFEKQQINNRTDINACEKKILINQIDSDQKNNRRISNIAFKTQFTAFVIIVIQLVLVVVILMMPKKNKPS
ncbi:hypothetical protein [Maribacter sp.]|uniref:hypothetical protein n=1 Tax=Maribacter sp. TaxID=1897614 RepID=UPI0025BE7745|nr:hypothetical protein [Maribacter sp.]